MRHKKLKLIGLLAFGLGLFGLQAQTIYVKEINGAQTAYALNNIRKLTFSEGNTNIQKKDNSKGVYALSRLKHLSFTNITADISYPTIQLGHFNFITYPNPVLTVLNVDLTSEIENGTISILTLEGKTIQTQNTIGNSVVTLNLSHLSTGIYLCRYSTAEKIITVKIIKQ